MFEKERPKWSVSTKSPNQLVLHPKRTSERNSSIWSFQFLKPVPLNLTWPFLCLFASNDFRGFLAGRLQISLSNIIDADWTIGCERADIAGKILADALLNREQVRYRNKLLLGSRSRYYQSYWYDRSNIVLNFERFLGKIYQNYWNQPVKYRTKLLTIFIESIAKAIKTTDQISQYFVIDYESTIMVDGMAGQISHPIWSCPKMYSCAFVNSGKESFQHRHTRDNVWYIHDVSTNTSTWLL